MGWGRIEKLAREKLQEIKTARLRQMELVLQDVIGEVLLYQAFLEVTKALWIEQHKRLGWDKQSRTSKSVVIKHNLGWGGEASSGAQVVPKGVAWRWGHILPS